MKGKYFLNRKKNIIFYFFFYLEFHGIEALLHKLYNKNI